MGPILLTGGSGQVGGGLLQSAGRTIEIVAPDRTALPLDRPERLAEVVASRAWGAVVNCAAYTAVDKAEGDVAAAWSANALGPAVLAAATRDAGIPLIHLSTDYVFDGTSERPYREQDPIAPLGVYGASKEGGEQAVRTANPQHIILRTAWVVSPRGANFVKTMLRFGAERPVLRVVADQHGCPTSADDIATAIITILGKIAGGSTEWGTYHFVNGGEASWHALAEAVFARAASHGYRVPVVEAIPTSAWPTPAARPANSRLATEKVTRAFGIMPRDWRTAVDAIVDELVQERAEP